MEEIESSFQDHYKSWSIAGMSLPGSGHMSFISFCRVLTCSQVALTCYEIIVEVNDFGS